MRSHRFMAVVLVLAVLPIPMVVLLLHRQVDLLRLLQDMDLELAVGKASPCFHSIRARYAVVSVCRPEDLVSRALGLESAATMISM